MLKIDSNMTIKMSRGDDVKFPLFINQGSRTNPIRYVFRGEDAEVISLPTSIKSATVNLPVWKTMVSNEGFYDFIYMSEAWTLGGNVVDIAEYGIHIVMAMNPSTGEDYTLVDGNRISIEYHKGDGCEVYFNIYHLRQPNTSPIFTKTFTSDRDLWRGKHNSEKPNGDMKIELLHTDPLVESDEDEYEMILEDIPEGEYVYQIKAKVLDTLASQETGEPQYVMNVVTNRLKLYIIDDDYSEREW